MPPWRLFSPTPVFNAYNFCGIFYSVFKKWDFKEKQEAETTREWSEETNDKTMASKRGTPAATTTRASSTTRHRHQPHILRITPTAISLRSPHGGTTRSTLISSNNLNCLDNSTDSKAVWETRSSHCLSGYPLPPDTLRPWNPTWHHTRRMLRHCGTRPPPRHLGRTLRAQQSAMWLPWVPLTSDSSCTETLQLC